MYYDNVLKEENSTRRFPSFKNADGIQKLVASMPDDLALGEWKPHTLEDSKCNANHQRPIKYWSLDIMKIMRWFMRQPAYAEHHIYAPQPCFNSNMPPKLLDTEMHTVDWWWETQVRRDTRVWWCANQGSINAQSGGYTGSLDHHVRRNASLEICWRQEWVACVYHNWQSICEAPPDALNAQHRNGRSPADSGHEPHYSSEAARYTAANKPRGAERGTPGGAPPSHL